MILFEDPLVFQKQCLFQRSRGRVLGLVPTLGNLHEGHLSLVRRAKQEADFVGISIFVNPLQFNDVEDFKRYPRTFEQDVALLQQEQVDAVFHPTPEDFYGEDMTTAVVEKSLTGVACGRLRPGHFEGVCTVVLKLLNLCWPHQVFFGEKDYQQLCVVKRMVESLSFPTVVRACPTVREASGLALSSRNTLLSPEDRKKAAEIYRVLQALKQHVEQHPQSSWQAVQMGGLERFQKDMAGFFELEYLEAFTQDRFEALSPQNSCAGKIVMCVAGKISGIRLIDNILVTTS